MNSDALVKGIESVTKKWCKQRKREERAQSARENRMWAMARRRRVSLKDAAWEVMERAYLKASSNNTLPAHARQIMYAARGEILQATGRDQLDDAYFTQTLLPNYVSEHPEAQEWDIVYDARGHFQEPHTGNGNVALGTIHVRDYLQRIQSHKVGPIEAGIAGGDRYPTCGPAHRFGAVLFIEKEGFLPLFERVKLAERFDLAIMSSKGMSNVASRKHVDTLCGEYQIPLLVLHDFDVAGFTILGTLTNDTRRYSFQNQIKVIDLGLRLVDVQECKLESEAFTSKREFEWTLREYGATEDEMAFLQSERVELNAFGSAELVAWIERKLDEHGVKKVIPDADIQAEAYRRVVEAENLKRVIEAAAEEARDRANAVKAPKNLDKRVRAMLKKNPAMAWDEAVAGIARAAEAQQDN